MTTDVDVVIVGGGAAGIGAARRLAMSDLSTELLEAEVRIGGRAWTTDISGMMLDMGCGWLHSAERNAWVGIAKAEGIALVETAAAWSTHYRDLGFSPADQAAAHEAFEKWASALARMPLTTDCAADALDSTSEWNSYIRAIVGFISGGPLEMLSAADYIAFDDASTGTNWRTLAGYGALITRALPSSITPQLAAPVESITLEAHGVTVTTAVGRVRARAVILTVSTEVLSGNTIKLPEALDPWREAARCLPLGRNEKFFLEITGDSPFENETHVLGDPRNVRACSFYIRPLGRPTIEVYFGGDGARFVDQAGPEAGFAYAIDQLEQLFGADIRRSLRPLTASGWGGNPLVGGAYSYALPRHANARQTLAQPFDRRIYFAGEATSSNDYSTAHGAHDSGVRAANEVIAALAPRNRQ